MRRNPIIDHQKRLGLANQEYAKSLGYGSVKMFMRERREMNNFIVARIMDRYDIDLSGAIRRILGDAFIARRKTEAA